MELFSAVVCLILAFISGLLIKDTAVISNVVSLLVPVPAIVLLTFMARGKLTNRKVLVCLLLSGFLIRLAYIMYTGAEVRQHDVHSFGGNNGHAAYIEYLYNYLRLPDFDPTSVWQFYHPPLHHALCAVWLHIQTFFGIPYDYAVEGLQYLTLFYSSIFMIVSFKIFEEFGLKPSAICAAGAVVSFCPALIIMSGSVNNDMLSVTFAMASLLYTIRWYKNPKTREIIKIALCIGLGMMTKLSAGTAAPAIAFVFLMKLIKSKGRRKNLFLQFGAFALVCIPLGLWWSVRNLVLFGVSPAYVPLLNENSFQYIGYHSVLQRFFDFSFYQFKSLYMAWGDTVRSFGVEPYMEFNPTIGLIKTLVFGEYVFALDNGIIIAVSYALLAGAAAFIILSLIALVKNFVNYKIRNCPVIFLMLLIEVLVVVISYYSFCIKYPHTCTMNMRYAIPLIPIFALFIGLVINRQDNKSIFQKIYKYTAYAVITVFCFSSFILYSII